MKAPLPTEELTDTVVLLDDQLAPAQVARSRLYRGLRQRLTIHDDTELPDALRTMQAGLAHGWFAVALFDYELGEQLQGLTPRDDAPVPNSQILLFDQCEHLNTSAVDSWLQEQTIQRQAPKPTLTGWQPNITPEDFAQAVATIRKHIESGDTYQVNLCFNVTATLTGDPIGLYRELRQHQAVGFGALIALPDGRWVLSRSPELFVSCKQGWLEARPMKGTARADSNLDLANDPKNQAENVMIVDLLRNDIGRVAEPGSVCVPERFNVQRYGDVLQMTSTVRAKLKPGVDWAELLAAVFPCGSITGAPKHRTMQIIRELETSPRGLYTGAIGWIDPQGSDRLSDFCFSVPIRTLTVTPPTPGGHRRVTLGVGAGITYSSDHTDEWAECQLKAGFLKRLVKPVGLFETMRAHRDLGIAHLERHIARLTASAQVLGYPLDTSAARETLARACAALAPETYHRLRLELGQNGDLDLTCGPLSDIETPVGLLLAPDPMSSNNTWLQHKTTDRARYDQAWRQAEQHGAFDMLFFNERDELTEGARSNVFVKLNGRWYTPPIQAGALPGVMRAVLLEDTSLGASVRTIAREDLLNAQDILVCNALRGVLPACILTEHVTESTTLS